MNSFTKQCLKILGFQGILALIGLPLGIKWYWVFLPLELILFLICLIGLILGIYWIATYKNINY